MTVVRWFFIIRFYAKVCFCIGTLYVSWLARVSTARGSAGSGTALLAPRRRTHGQRERFLLGQKFVLGAPFPSPCWVPKINTSGTNFEHQVGNGTTDQEKNDWRVLNGKLVKNTSLTALTLGTNQESGRGEGKKRTQGSLNKLQQEPQGENFPEYKSQLKHSWRGAFNCFSGKLIPAGFEDGTALGLKPFTNYIVRRRLRAKSLFCLFGFFFCF